jgi:hypothetical protein
VTNLRADHLKRGLKILITVMKPFLSQNAAHGALPTLYAAVAAEAVAGGYYGPDGFAELKGYPTAVSVPHRALDETIALRLWVESERLTHVKFGAHSDGDLPAHASVIDAYHAEHGATSQLHPFHHLARP